jgi:hypothetical protein
MRTRTGTLVLALALAAPTAFAGVMVTEVTPVATSVGGYDMVGFEPGTLPGTATSATSVNGDVVNFTTKNGAAPQPMTVSNNATEFAAGKGTWWSGATEPFYKAPLNGSGAVNWVELVMPENTFAFSLTIDASAGARAWILGVDDTGNAIDTAGNSFTLGPDGNYDPKNPAFTIPLNGPARSYGFYTDNSAGSCNTLSKVVIDPVYWAMGDFSIHVSDTGCGGTEVPEPTPLLLVFGGLALLALRSRQRRA